MNNSSKHFFWSGMNAGFLLLLILAAAVGGAESPRLLYLFLLFALCSSPMLFADEMNGRYVILFIMLPVYFVLYGVADLLALFTGASTGSKGLLDLTESAVLLGAAMLLFGFLTAVGRPKHDAAEVHDWQSAAILWIGLIFWSVGVLATLYWQVRVQKRGFDIGYVAPILGMAITLGRLLQPLGTALLAYRLVKSGGWIMWLLMVSLLSVEFVVGFICDSKELSIRGVLIALITKFLVEGRVPKKWLMAGCVIVTLSFPVFQAYRFEVLGVRGQAREQAAQDLMENLTIAIKSVTQPNTFGTQTGPGFIGRVSLKSNMTMALQRVGDTASFQNGYTYGLFFKGLVPRIFWADKPDASVGQLFNRELQISRFRDVYISPTFLGEFYWNFGWPGIVVGMFLFGVLLGWIGGRFAQSEGVTVTRFLVLLLTLYSFCLRFEGGMALEALVWLRGLAAVAVLHWLLARSAGRIKSVEAEPRDAMVPTVLGNLMR